MAKKQVHKVVTPLKPFLVDVTTLNLDLENANKHDESQIADLAAVIDEHGQDVPLVVQKKGMIIRKGEGRFLAMTQQLGWTCDRSQTTRSRVVAFGMMVY